MEKRGQISIFIILGIVVVGVIIASLYLTKEPVQPTQTPVQVDPIREHVEECLDLVSLRGLKLLGMQGGYTDISNKDVLSYMNGKLNVVYWLDEDSLKAPKFSRIENELEKFIEKDMEGCVNFDLFEDFRIEEGNIKANVDFDEIIYINVEWPLKVVKNDVEYELKDFSNNYDVDMKKIYKLAYGIAETEKTYNFLEDKTLFLIDTYSGVSLDKLPPFAEYDFGCGVVKWPLISVKQKLKTVLKENIPYLKVEGMVFDRKKSVVYDSFIYDIFRENFEGVRVDFRYLDEFPLYLDVNPKKGSYVEPEKGKFNLLLNILCMNKYYFKYDVAYPVLVEISDSNALNGEGYSFRVPLLVVIKGNNARYRLYSDVEIEEEKSLFCDEEQRISGDILIGAVDAKDGSRLNADVYYSCIDEDCYISETGVEKGNVKLPICKGGVLSLEEDGYFSASRRFDSVEGKGFDVGDLKLEPFRKKKISIVKHMVVGDKIASTGDLNDYENVVITLERLPDDVGGKTYSAVINEDINEIDLVPGVYDVKAILIYNGEIVIPKEKKCASEVLGVCVKHYELPEVKMDNLVIGGAEYRWELEEEIDLGDLEFYVLSEEIPRNHDELIELFDNIDKHNGLFKDDVIPQII